MRGPGVLTQGTSPARARTRAERFDALVVASLGEIEARWHDRLGLVEYAVEDAPHLPDDWTSPGSPHDAAVPLSSLLPGSGGRPARLVLFRRPIEHRCRDRSDLEALVHTVLVEQVAALLGIEAEEVDPRYGEG